MCYAYSQSAYDDQLAQSLDLQSWGETVVPALAINDGHEDIDTQYSVYEDYDFAGYTVWKGEDISSGLP
jgi:hypothetical protein